MKLFSEQAGEGKPLIILHGFLGMSDNWRSAGKKLAAHVCVYFVDLRNHGRSPHSPDFGYPEMQADLLEFLQEKNLACVSILGHSMGGKVAMKFALAFPEMVERLLIADISPARTSVDTTLSGLLDVMRALPLDTFRSYEDISRILAGQIKEERLRGFVLKNIRKSAGGTFMWKPNVPVLYANAWRLREEIVSDKPFAGPVLFIKGEKSNYIRPSDSDLIKQLFPSALIREIRGAGHWLHAEKPDEFLQVAKGFLLDKLPA
jgi:esterase